MPILVFEATGRVAVIACDDPEAAADVRPVGEFDTPAAAVAGLLARYGFHRTLAAVFQLARVSDEALAHVMNACEDAEVARCRARHAGAVAALVELKPVAAAAGACDSGDCTGPDDDDQDDDDSDSTPLEVCGAD